MCVSCVTMGGWRFGCLSVSSVLVGGVGVDGGAVRLLAVFARGHPLVYPVQTARLLKVTDLPRGGEALNGWRAEEERGSSVSIKVDSTSQKHQYESGTATKTHAQVNKDSSSSDASGTNYDSTTPHTLLTYGNAPETARERAQMESKLVRDLSR